MRAEERSAVLDLLEAAFGRRHLFAGYMDLDPAFDPSDFLLACDGGAPVACVQTFEKRVRLGSGAVKLGGIGSVATRPDYRSRGLASELLRRTEAAMRERDIALGLLFSDLVPLYGPLGWITIPARQVALHAAADAPQPPSPPPPPPEGTDRPFAPDDLPAVAALYAAYCESMPGSTLRDAAYWRGQLRYAGNPDESFRVAERAGEIVAYVRTVRLYGIDQVMEYARTDDAADALAALVLARCPDKGALMARLAPDPALEAALRGRASRFDRVDATDLMWRVLDREALAKLAGLPAASDDRALVDALVAEPPAHYWLSDRF